MQRLVLHQDELEHFALQVRYVDSLKLQDIDSAFLSDEGLTHVEEALGVEEFTTRCVEFLQLSAVVEQVSQDLAVGLFIKQNPQDAHLPDLDTELQAFHEGSEIGDWLLKFNLLYAERFNQLFLT